MDSHERAHQFNQPNVDPFSKEQMDSWPGFGRLEYFVVGILAGFAGLALASVLPNSLGLFVALVTVGVLIFIGVRRLHNLGNSGWWFVLNFVPVVNVVLSTYLLAFPPGYAYHRQMDTACKVIVGIAVVATILVFVFEGALP